MMRRSVSTADSGTPVQSTGVDESSNGIRTLSLMALARAQPARYNLKAPASRGSRNDEPPAALCVGRRDGQHPGGARPARRPPLTAPTEGKKIPAAGEPEGGPAANAGLPRRSAIARTRACRAEAR